MKEEKDSRAAGAHGQDIETIEANIQNTDISKDDKNVKKNYQTTSVVSDKQKAISKLPNEQDANRIKNTDGVKKGSFAIDDQTRNEYNANIKKNIESDQNLNQNKKTFDKIEENQSKNPKEIAIDIKTLEYNSTASIQSTEGNDDEQREKTNESIISTESTYSSESTDKSKKVDNNIKSVQDVSSNTSDKKEAEELAKQKKLEQIQVNLNKLSSKELKFSDKIANDLGSSYPEGVSQEVFNQNDEDGLLIAVVTRRIVVKNGYGQVYLRTQSLNGLTYSKNGDPSSEFVWQLETQDSKLKKNY